MGYDGKKVAEINRLRAVGGREVKKFWSEGKKWVLVVFTVMLLFSFILLGFWFLGKEPKISPPLPQEQGEETGKKEIPRFVPPFLKFRPTPQGPFPWQKRDGITPVHWSGHHGRGHHGFYSSPYPPAVIYDYGIYTRVVPWGYAFQYGDCYGCEYGRGYGWEAPSTPRCFELRQPSGAHLKWCL